MPPGSDRDTGSYTSNLSLRPGKGEERRDGLLPLTREPLSPLPPSPHHLQD